jgi:hypothetical protein
MSKTHLIIPDAHAHPDFNNNRADYLGKLILDLRPDVVVNLGDGYDMASLSTYDKGKRAFAGRSYSRDIAAGNEFQERTWLPLKRAKKRWPRAVYLEGNHEHRIERALDISPELQGTIGFSDYRLNDYYHEVVRYEGGTPGIIEVDGIYYAHYFISGIMGRPIGGVKPAYAIRAANGKSSVCGHIHTADVNIHTNIDGNKTVCVVAGVYQDYDSPWAGNINKLWWRGVVIARNVEDGVFDPQFVSIDQLRKEYDK